jgi:hypothetical protein
MMDNNMTMLWNGLISLGSRMLGTAIGIWQATWLANRNAHRAAVSDLRAAFAPEMAIVRTTPHDTWNSLERILGDPKVDLKEILRVAFERHATAIEKFRFFVRPASLSAYDATWRAYYMEEGKIGFLRYMYGDSGQTDFLGNVEAIFRFTG